jgi:integrase
MEEWIQFRDLITPATIPVKVTPSHLSSAKDILYQLLVELYGIPSISRLCAEKSFDTDLRAKITTCVTNICEQHKWKRTTSQKMLGILRHMLTHCKISRYVTKAICLSPKKRPWNKMIGMEHGRKPETDSVRIMLENWVKILFSNTDNISTLSVRNIMYFYMNQLVPVLGLDVGNWPDDVSAVVLPKMLQESIIHQICGKTTCNQKKFTWLQIWLTHIAKCDLVLPLTVKSALKRQHPEKPMDDGSDRHRISKENLETLYHFAKNNPLDEMFFLTLMTTGMRIRGYACIQIRNVADQTSSGKWTMREKGLTTEKGNKAFTFMIHSRVQHLMQRWITFHRPSDPSPFLLPGKCGSHIDTDTLRKRFGKLCSLANLSGQEYHPHALRHCYSHILLELGNTADVVAKLINHSSSKTTEKYYLKESADQVAQRANIPWMNTEKPKNNPVPQFLTDLASKHKPSLHQRQERLEELTKNIQERVKKYKC